MDHSDSRLSAVISNLLGPGGYCPVNWLPDTDVNAYCRCVPTAVKEIKLL